MPQQIRNESHNTKKVSTFLLKRENNDFVCQMSDFKQTHQALLLKRFSMYTAQQERRITFVHTLCQDLFMSVKLSRGRRGRKYVL